MSDNVLLHLGEEPRFDQIKTEDIKPALQTAIAEAREQIAAIKAQTHTDWANTVEKLTDITERVGRIWSVVSHLNSVVDTPELRAVYNELMPEITIFFTEIGQDIELYNRFKIIKNSAEFNTLSQAQQTKLNHDLRDFVLSGAELPPEQQAELAQLQTEGAQLGVKFAQNVQDAINANLGDAIATAIDPRTVTLQKPQDVSVIELLNRVLNLEVDYKADDKIVIDERTGTVVSGIDAVVDPVVLTHGNITLKIEPSSFDDTQEGDINLQDNVAIAPNANMLKISGEKTTVANVTRALNRLGASPSDIIAIIENLKRAGAIHVEVEII